MTQTLIKDTWAEIIDKALERTLVKDDNVPFGEVAHDSFLKSMADSFKGMQNPIPSLLKEESQQGNLSHTRHEKLKELIGNIRTIANASGLEVPAAQGRSQ